ncbi:hypothetical protein HMPREF0322_02107 [Desulfitobacterium hafniense DP7]|uniref:PilS cassette n=1 Tax=Desulfitobacterium hafniense DP7 TaxID=537010 RepID=G9XMC1_DESHA|nr:hypothetical protein HMPREF0322_02107 [Desulfitobacterium hafniense DP7]
MARPFPIINHKQQSGNVSLLKKIVFSNFKGFLPRNREFSS